MTRISLNLRHAAEASDLSVRSLQYAIDEGSLRVHYGGESNTKPLIHVDDLDAYIRSLPTARTGKVA